jgi:L-arabinose isomerase
MDMKSLEAWFVTGSQGLYGEETLRQVAADSQRIVEELNATAQLPIRLVFKPVVTTSESILETCRAANAASNCVGVICWMHTFSPAKMWIAGLSALQKPMAHLHTQFNRDLPWSTIDMDFMNLHQAAHGDREFGFICTRMQKARKVIVGHWQNAKVHERLGVWMRAAAGVLEMRRLKVARFGDNMRQVAVTEGDKVEAQIRFGCEVNTYGVGTLVDAMHAVSDVEIDHLVREYDERYAIAPELRQGGPRRDSLRYEARIELGLRAFLNARGFKAFINTFEDLTGINQLPGLATQRLMADGFGFGAEGDWKTAALGRVLKFMSIGLSGGTSFMEDYTYHLAPEGAKVLGAHMLEVCPTLAAGKPSCEIHPLGIGGKSDPVRLVFTASPGPAINVAMIDMGDRFRMLVNELDMVTPDQPLPRLPVAQAFWTPLPNLETSAASWIYAGGPHHMVLSQALTSEHLLDFAEMFGVECVLIDNQTRVSDIKNELRWNQAYFAKR